MLRITEVNPLITNLVLVGEENSVDRVGGDNKFVRASIGVKMAKSKS